MTSCVWFSISNFGGSGLVVFEGWSMTQLPQVEFQSCMGNIVAEELLGNGVGFAQSVVLDELGVGGGVRVGGECLGEQGC